ncbi:Hypothetical protein PHPALM_303 [Phytophthora palmivora]|uniref:MULE transposase domain-containing protein n=1 Tax=Phytophthora palmivora TaxID=4796 RepID=A0A2P4YV63_9STRA|nr:Hypothetical protein PHPALM_303 [Phytophthora palmivora]
MESLAVCFKFHSDLADGDPFLFGYDVRENGAPVFGIGSDVDPLVVGVSTPFIITTLCFAEEYVFHIDVTHKLNQSGYPTTVVGVSDSSRSFHPVAMFAASQVTGPVMTLPLSHLFDTYKEITGEFPTIRYCMADAHKAQFNAVAAVNALKTNPPTNVGEHIRGVVGESVSLILHHLYQMHFARNEEEFRRFSDAAIEKWKAVPELVTFAEYFKKQWLDTTLSNWSVFHTPPGYATTNNPVETFNKVIKQDYTFYSSVKLVGMAGRFRKSQYRTENY